MRAGLPRVLARLAVAAVAAASALVGSAVPAAPELQALTGADLPGSAWQRLGLPRQTKPRTRFSVVNLEGESVLRIEADDSYGNLVHAVPSEANVNTNAKRHLSWRWRIDEPNTKANLRLKSGDDSAVKVCAMFDLPIEAVPFIEQQLLRLARERSGDRLPAATVCYVWDSQLSAGTVLDNAFSRRLRTIVLRGADAPLHSWRMERRDLLADFLQLFGDESKTVPTLLGIGIGGDADNTHAHSLAHLTDLLLQ